MRMSNHLVPDDWAQNFCSGLHSRDVWKGFPEEVGCEKMVILRGGERAAGLGLPETD